ncbi:MAG TPA: Flp pilus assembly protein CpaB [Herpetosiphonaceae bacterium]
MPARRGWILILLGMVLALATGGLVYSLLRGAVPAQSANTAVIPPTPVPTKPIPVAGRELGAGTTISDTDVMMQDYPEDLLPVGVLTDTAAIEGQILAEPIKEGEFFRPSQMIGSSTGPLSEQIESERVVVAFPVDDLMAQSKVIQEGDRVDLLLTLDIEEESATETRKGKSTNITLQNVSVFRIIRDDATEENPNPQPKSILFEMSPQDAVIAKFVKDAGGVLDLSLRSPLDTATFDTEMINQDYLFDNYDFRAPVSSSRQKQ